MGSPWGFTGVAVGIWLYGLEALASPNPRLIREADRYCQFGNQALRTGNVHRAKALYQKALKALPSFPDAHLGMGHVAMSEHSFELALEEYLEARDLYVQFGDSLFDLQIQHYTLAQEQIAQLGTKIRQYRGFLATQIAMNSSLIEKQVTELEAAVQQLQAVKPPDLATLHEAPGEVHFFIGNALFNLGKGDEALAEWETCTRVSPRFSVAYNNLAVAYWKKGDFAQAIESLVRAERLGLPVNPGFKADLARTARESLSRAGLGGEVQR